MLVAHFAEITTTRSDQDQHRVYKDGRYIGAYIQEGDIRGMYVHLDNEGANSIGHGEEKEESMNLADTIKNFQKDFQSHKANNERLMKSKE
jgi:hypothetical protein